MLQLAHLLDRFKNIKPPHDTVKRHIIADIKELFGVDIRREDIEVKHTTICINISGPLKTEIFMQKKQLLDRLQQSLKEEKIGDIR